MESLKYRFHTKIIYNFPINISNTIYNVRSLIYCLVFIFNFMIHDNLGVIDVLKTSSMAENSVFILSFNFYFFHYLLTLKFSLIQQ